VTLPLLAAALLVPSTASAEPALCSKAGVKAALRSAGELHGLTVSQVRCGDVTADGVADATYALNSGGTAGNTRFGVVRGGDTPKVVKAAEGYKVGVARRSRRSFEVLQPVYRAEDPNCCPSSFAVTRYRWNGKRFRAAGTRQLDHAPKRFAT
jgi:hypothetical protein